MAKKRNELYYQLPRGVGLEELTDEEAGQVWKALDRYNGERETMPKATMRLIYRQCCDHIDTENERYDAYCEKQKEISRRRQSWKEKHQADVEKTSNDIEGYPTTSYNQNHNHNTESESESKTESNHLSLSREGVGESESESVNFYDMTITDEDYMARLAMNTGLSFEDVKIGVKMAENAFVMDGNFPKLLGDFKPRARNYVQSHVKDIKEHIENGNNHDNRTAGDAVADWVARRIAKRKSTMEHD